MGLEPFNVYVRFLSMPHDVRRVRVTEGMPLEAVEELVREVEARVTAARSDRHTSSDAERDAAAADATALAVARLQLLARYERDVLAVENNRLEREERELDYKRNVAQRGRLRMLELLARLADRLALPRSADLHVSAKPPGERGTALEQ